MKMGIGSNQGDTGTGAPGSTDTDCPSTYRLYEKYSRPWDLLRKKKKKKIQEKQKLF